MKKLFNLIGSSTLILLGAIGLGSLLGTQVEGFSERADNWVDPLILALMALLFFEVPFGKLAQAGKDWKFLSLAWVANFVFIPLIGWGIASLFFSQNAALLTGLLLYFMAPCTDWFLGFTKLAKGDTSLGTVLIPINMISQLLLIPVFLLLFASSSMDIKFDRMLSSLWDWVALPLLGAALARVLLRLILPKAIFEGVLNFVSHLIPWAIAALVTCLFAVHVGTIFENVNTFLLILLAVFIFFLLTWVLGEVLAKRAKLSYPKQVLLTMTTAARNAPLMLGYSQILFPNQPLLYAAIIIGMLVEFPHLTFLKRLMLSRAPASEATSSLPNSST